MGELFIARHGQNEDNVNGILNGHRDLPLTELGRQQARQLAVEIGRAGLAIDVVLASPLSRALETAQIVCEENGWPEPIIEPLLIERDFGVMTGELTSSIKEKCAPDIIETDTITYFLSPEGAETFEDLVARGRAFIDKTKFNYGEKNVLAVCHGDIGKMIYAAASGKPWRDVLLEFHFGNGELIDVSSKDAHIVSLEQYNH